MTSKNKTRLKKKSILYLVGGVLFMFGFAYMLVPLYTLVCKQLGINGRTTNTPTVLPSSIKVDPTRSIDVSFTATVHGNLGFVFKPLIRHVTVHPGEVKLVYYYAQNNSGKPLTVQAIPSITPDYTAKYFKKTQCFCFTQQYFFAGEKADMPVYFYIDPKLPKKTQAITLSYTLFDVSEHLKKNQAHYRRGRIDIQ